MSRTWGTGSTAGLLVLTERLENDLVKTIYTTKLHFVSRWQKQLKVMLGTNYDRIVDENSVFFAECNCAKSLTQNHTKINH